MTQPTAVSEAIFIASQKIKYADQILSDLTFSNIGRELPTGVFADILRAREALLKTTKRIELYQREGV
tara:strand:- start:4400 stop:4603 length:204 start_codon:yes stop_codon:yes gene_type:complete